MALVLGRNINNWPRVQNMRDSQNYINEQVKTDLIERLNNQVLDEMDRTKRRQPKAVDSNDAVVDVSRYQVSGRSRFLRHAPVIFRRSRQNIFHESLIEDCVVAGTKMAPKSHSRAILNLFI